jgi:hypothetical protein
VISKAIKGLFLSTQPNSQQPNMTRPNIDTIKTGKELKRWYWLKEELVAYCQHKGLSYVGVKFDMLERIATSLDKGTAPTKSKTTPIKARSTFDWHAASLALNTLITDSYKNTQNVRRFFQQHCGQKFHFSIPFMAFMKNNCGKTLQQAIDEWQRLNKQQKDKNFKSEIPAGNQYNQYIRDFFADNPNMTIEQARHFWKLKKGLPLGRHVYERKDLKLGGGALVLIE